jgi:hypothetical protein
MSVLETKKPKFKIGLNEATLIIFKTKGIINLPDPLIDYSDGQIIYMLENNNYIIINAKSKGYNLHKFKINNINDNIGDKRNNKLKEIIKDVNGIDELVAEFQNIYNCLDV